MEDVLSSVNATEDIVEDFARQLDEGTISRLIYEISL
jgi:hypothetical protein